MAEKKRIKRVLRQLSSTLRTAVNELERGSEDDDEESGFDTSVSTAEPRSSSTDTSASSLIKRARKLANACRPEPKRTVKLQLDSSKVVEDSFIMIGVCEMVKVKSRTGYKYMPNGPYAELQVKKEDNYCTFTSKASSALNIKSVDKLSVFKPSGVVVPNSKLMVRSKEKTWTVGNYLAAIKTGPQKLRLGVGRISSSSDSSDSESDVEHNESPVLSACTSLRQNLTQSSAAVYSDSSYSVISPAYSNITAVNKIRSHRKPTSEGKIPDSFIDLTSPIIRAHEVEIDEEAATKSPLSQKATHDKTSDSTAETMVTHTWSLEFSNKDLTDASNKFETLLGEGGFGKVYKGYLHCTHVAIKILSNVQTTVNTDSEIDQLLREMTALTKYRHKNVVELMGFCTSPPAIVYEYMENGSLYDNLHTVKYINILFATYTVII
jgi:hypothetical protein